MSNIKKPVESQRQYGFFTVLAMLFIYWLVLLKQSVIKLLFSFSTPCRTAFCSLSHSGAVLSGHKISELSPFSFLFQKYSYFSFFPNPFFPIHFLFSIPIFWGLNNNRIAFSRSTAIHPAVWKRQSFIYTNAFSYYPYPFDFQQI